MTRIRVRSLLLAGAAGFLPVLGAPVFGEVPRKQPIARYTDLWSKSPFTVPPVVVEPEKVEENPLEDYTLAGVCKLKEGWFVVLINKKQRDERLRIKPNAENAEGFQVVKVENGDGHLDTKVEIKTRSGKTGWVEYDSKFIALKKASAKAPPGGARPGQPPVPQRPGVPQPAVATPQPPIPTAGTSGERPSRVRRVPTPPTR